MELLKRIEEFGAGRLAEKIDDAVWEKGGTYKSEVFGEIELIEKSGGEGQGDSYFIVVNFKKEDKLIRFDGWYSSYDGVNFNDDFKEVKPVEKTITVYE